MREDAINDHLKRIAERAVGTCLGQRAVSVSRFAVGLSHHVYDVVTNHNDCIVVRIAKPSRREELQGGLYWHGRLEEVGVPLPRLLGSGEVERYPYAVYERLPGTDLEKIYSTLHEADRKRFAEGVAEIQRKVHTLPQAHGHGHALSYDDPCLAKFSSWKDVLTAILDRTEHELAASGSPDIRYVALVRKEIARAEEYLSTVAPIAFLYDTNIRNVIIHEGQISGIIDVDEVTFGDPLLSVGFTKTYLLLAEEDTEFVEYWCETLDCTAVDLGIIDLYALVYAVRFMGTLGQTLNGNPSRIIDPGNATRLEEIADRLLAGLTRR